MQNYCLKHVKFWKTLDCDDLKGPVSVWERCSIANTVVMMLSIGPSSLDLVDNTAGLRGRSRSGRRNHVGLHFWRCLTLDVVEEVWWLKDLDYCSQNWIVWLDESGWFDDEKRIRIRGLRVDLYSFSLLSRHEDESSLKLVESFCEAISNCSDVGFVPAKIVQAIMYTISLCVY